MISDLAVSMETEDESNQWCEVRKKRKPKRKVIQNPQIMNADCWRLVFDRLCIQDVVRCERVSRGWQRAVKEYLSGIHNFWIDGSFYYETVPESYFENKRTLYYSEGENFCQMIQKLGPYMKSLTVCTDRDQFRDVVHYCSNLEDLTLIEPLRHIKLELLKKLRHIRRIILYGSHANDEQLKEIVKSESLEELEIFVNSQAVGSFLKHLNQNLKILKVGSCEVTIPEQIKSCAGWPGMKHLQLNCQLQHLPLLLDKMPNLEYLGFTSASNLTGSDDIFLNSISQLSQLRELNLCGTYFVTDDFLCRVARTLERLQGVDVSECRFLTAAGVLELCRLRPTLKSLGLGYLPLSDADVEACVRYCEGLECLKIFLHDVGTSSVLYRIARPRVRPLHILLYGYREHFTDVPEKLEGLKITWYDWTN